MALFSNFVRSGRFAAAKDRFYARKRRNSYERFFEDYQEVRTVSSDGRARIQRIYQGSYYRALLPEKSLKQRRGVEVCLELAAIICFLFAALRPCASNSAWYMAAAQALCLALLAMSSLSTFRCVVAPAYMEVRVYKDAAKLKQRSLFCAGAFALLVLTTAAYMLLQRAQAGAAEAGMLLCFLTGGLCQFAVYRLEAKLKFEVLPNDVRRNS